MSQFPPETTFGEPHSGYMDQPQTTSGLAVTALVCSLILCCPVTTILGILLGLGALASIGKNPAKKGKGLAIAAIILGLLFTAGQAFFGYSMYKAYEVFKSAPADTLSKGFSGDIAGFKASFGTAGAATSDAEAQAFLDKLTDRYGTLQSSELDFAQFQNMQPQSPGAQTQTIPWSLVFSDQTVPVEMTFNSADQRGGNEIIFSNITVFDAVEGDLQFPPAPASTSPGTGGDADAPDDAPDDDSDELGDGG